MPQLVLPPSTDEAEAKLEYIFATWPVLFLIKHGTEKLVSCIMD